MSVTTSRPAIEGGLIFDLTERSFALVLSVGAIVRLAPAILDQPNVLLLLVSELLAVAFILLRRPAQRIDVTPFAALVAFLGTCASLLVMAPKNGWLPASVGYVLMIAGLLLSIAAKVALNRSFGLTAANRGVKRAGPYRYIRHPMYAGYALTQVVFLLLHPCWWNLCAYAVGWTAQLLRIQAEEKVLLEDPAYQVYAAQVRFRLIPGLF